MGQDGLGVLGGPTIGEQFFPLGIVSMGSQEDLAEIPPRFEAMTLCSGENRVQHGGPWSRLFTAQEQPILASDRLMPKRSLRGVVVDREAAVLRVTSQGVPLVACIGDALANALLGNTLGLSSAR